jgi:hypothetical protein
MQQHGCSKESKSSIAFLTIGSYFFLDMRVRWPESEKKTPWILARASTISAGPIQECRISPCGNGPCCWMISCSLPNAVTQCTCITDSWNEHCLHSIFSKGVRDVAQTHPPDTVHGGMLGLVIIADISGALLVPASSSGCDIAG